MLEARGLNLGFPQAPFIILPLVHGAFDFRVLHQNRRVVTDESRRAEIECFHQVLADISYCRSTDAVRKFFVDAYVRGVRVDSAERAPLEGLTAVFTKRRYRDAWNRAVIQRIARAHNHSLKIKARVRARGARGQGWFGEKRVKVVRSKTRAQSSWLLHLAGDHHAAFETKPVMHVPHLMRCMLNANLAVDQRFANGRPCLAAYCLALRLARSMCALDVCSERVASRCWCDASKDAGSLAALEPGH